MSKTYFVELSICRHNSSLVGNLTIHGIASLHLKEKVITLPQQQGLLKMTEWKNRLVYVKATSQMGGGVCIDIIYVYSANNHNFKLSRLGMLCSVYCIYIITTNGYSNLKFSKACSSMFKVS